MKKTFILLAVVFLSLNCSQAIAQDLNIGLRLGLNANRNSGDYIKNDFEASFLGGAYVSLSAKSIAVSLEPYYSQTSVSVGNNFGDAFKQYLKDGASNIKEGKIVFQQLSLPVLLGIKITNRLWIQVGPQFTGIVSMQDKDEILNETKDVFRSGEISGVAGLWLNLPFKLNAQLRYIHGFTNLNNTAIEDQWKMGHFQLSAGIKLF